jgi:hypothetical protein
MARSGALHVTSTWSRFRRLARCFGTRTALSEVVGSAAGGAELLEEGVVVDLDVLVDDSAFIVIAEDVDQFEHNVLAVGRQRTDR